MILTGREIKALRGALMLHDHGPYVRTKKAAIGAAQQEIARLADEKLKVARQSLEPHEPRDTPGWLDQVLNGQADVPLTPSELLVLVTLTRAALAELDNDNDLLVLVGPGVGLEALRSGYSKISDSRRHVS